jgi:hypothetical protein|tara:strand:+ start:2001 stop:2138 length:138 start_codon:yes stop_codon:yes gene_type:complete
MNKNVIKFPQPSEIDKQFIELEKQNKEIASQRKLIKKVNEEKNDS